MSTRDVHTSIGKYTRQQLYQHFWLKLQRVFIFFDCPMIYSAYIIPPARLKGCDRWPEGIIYHLAACNSNTTNVFCATPLASHLHQNAQQWFSLIEGPIFLREVRAHPSEIFGAMSENQSNSCLSPGNRVGCIAVCPWPRIAWQRATSMH